LNLLQLAAILKKYCPLVPACSEFFVPFVFTPCKPFLFWEKWFHYSSYNNETRFLVTVLYLNINQFISLPFFVSFPFFRRQNIKNFKKLNFFIIRACFKRGGAFLCFFIKSFPHITFKVSLQIHKPLYQRRLKTPRPNS
jgi:hypothetical protein